MNLIDREDQSNQELEKKIWATDLLIRGPESLACDELIG
jgi:hypothetical protein